MANQRVRKAVIPAAGLGTRFLPATKTVPKELLTIVDRPILLYIVEEAVRAGIEEIILVAGRGKTAIEDFFDTSYELEDTLEKKGKTDLLERIRRVKDLATVISIRQKEAMGLGHAVLTAAPVVGSEPFAVLLGDEIMISGPKEQTVTENLCRIYDETGLSSVAVMEVARENVSKYGIIACKDRGPGTYDVTDVVEKPSADEAPSQLALPGRYVFDSQIFSYLRETQPGKNGEIQLTDAMTRIAQSHGLIASKIKARRFDAGDKLGYLQANVELALEHDELGDSFRSYLKELAARL